MDTVPLSNDGRIGSSHLAIEHFTGGEQTFNGWISKIGYRKAKAYSCQFQSKDVNFTHKFGIYKPVSAIEAKRIKDYIESIGGKVTVFDYENLIKSVV